MGRKRIRSPSTSPLVGYKRSKSQSYEAVTTKGKATTRSASLSADRQTVRVSVEDTLTSEETLSYDNTLEPLIGLRSYISDLERYINSDKVLFGELTDYSCVTTGAGKPLLSSTRESLIDEFDDCDEHIEDTTAIKIIVNSASESESSEVFSQALDDTIFVSRTSSPLCPVNGPPPPTAASQPGPPTAAAILLPPPVEPNPLCPAAAAALPPPLSAIAAVLVCPPTADSELPPPRDNTVPPVKPRTIFTPTPSPRPASSQTDNSLDKSVEIVLPPSSENSLWEPVAATDNVMMEAVDTFLRAEMAWADDYDQVDLSQVPLNGINQLVEKAIQYKDELSEAYIKLRKATPEQLSEVGSLESVLELKNKFVSFKKQGWAKSSQMSGNVRTEQSRPGTATSQMSAATEEIVTARVTSRKPKLLAQAAGIQNDLTEFIGQRPANNQALIELENDLDTTKAEAKECIEGLKELGALATTVGLADPAKELIEAADRIGELRTQAVTSVREARADLGIPAGPINRHIALSLKPPVFKGEFKDQIDFFTFEKRFREYVESIGMSSHSDKLLKLRAECVTGAAKDSIVSAKTYQEAMDILRDLYAKPEVLIAVKSQELLNMGRCPDNMIAKRSWCINVANKYTYLRELAIEHEIDDFIHTSDLPHKVVELMVKNDQDKFENKITKSHRADPSQRITKQRVGDKMLSFLKDMVQDISCKLDYRIAKGFGNTEEMMKSLDLDGKRVNKVQNQTTNQPGKRQSYHTNEASNNMETQQPSDNTSDAKSKRQKRRERQAGSQSERAARQAITPDLNISEQTVMTNKSAKPQQVKCCLCEGMHESMVYCPAFKKARVKDRWILILKTKACFRCLRSDANFTLDNRENWFKEHKPYCSDRNICKHGPCPTKDQWFQNHILVCGRHYKQNSEDYSDFLSTIDTSRLQGSRKFFYTSPQILNVQPLTHTQDTDIHQVKHLAKSPVYMLQLTPAPDGTPLLVFYDSGCMEAAISDRAMSVLETTCARPGPTILDVAGGQSYQIPYGYEKFYLQTDGNGQVEIVGLRMPEITSEFPTWRLKEAWEDLKVEYIKTGGKLEDLPTCPDEIGGASVDVMLGIEYLSHFPKPVFELESGLTLFKTKFKSFNGNYGILGGPHSSWTNTSTNTHIMNPRMYFTDGIKSINSQHMVARTQLKLETPCISEDFLAMENPNNTIYQSTGCELNGEFDWIDDIDTVENPIVMYCYQAVARDLKRFEEADNIGSEITYRCPGCRICSGCKKGELIEAQSLIEEAEQALIDTCVTLDKDQRKLFTKLPFIKDPEVKLTNNRRIAEKVLQTQIKLIEKNPGMKAEVDKAHQKLQSKGYVVPLTSLPEQVQKDVLTNQYYIPWRTVFKSGSLSTPCRLVYDASSRSPGGESLNEVLAKGENKLARLLHLLIRFRYGCEAFSSDVSMAYNQIWLETSEYKYQKYLWRENLTAEEATIVMVIITIIYGVRPSGNLTIAGFAEIVKHARTIGGKLLSGARALEDSSYMDDIFSAFPSLRERNDAAASLVEVLKLGNMCVKAITRSGEPPPAEVSVDGVHVGLVGYLWDSRADTIKLDIKPLTFGKSKRGKPADPVDGDIREALEGKFTKRVLAGRVASVYDPLCASCPIMSQVKIDMSEVCKLKVQWDDKLPPTMMDTWVTNIERMQLLHTIEIPRDIGNKLEGNNKFDMIVCSDASQSIAAAVVYARFEVSPGKYQCNFVIAKSKIVTKSTIPKNELRAATMAAALSHVVRLNLGQWIGREIFVTDSTITLFWMIQDSRPLQVGVRNAVLEIRRHTSMENWFHIPGELNPADIPTRPVEVKDIVGDSEWFRGKEWMSGPVDEMPLKSAADIKLSGEEKVLAAKEIRKNDARGMVLHNVIKTISENYEDKRGIVLNNIVAQMAARYKFSDYLIDPGMMSWPKYLRHLALVIKCLKIWRHKKDKFKVLAGKPIVMIELDDLQAAERYTFLKTTEELVEFNDVKSYKELGKMKDDVFTYTDRILEVEKANKVAGAMLDLGPVSFCKPVVDRFSPVAYSIMIHVHEELTHHASATAALRRSRDIVFILRGKSLAEEIRKSCVYCRRYKAKLEQAVMSKLHSNRLTPAPPFYFTQCDLFGPYTARCEHRSHRADVKIWGAAFKCMTTLGVWIEVMTAYDASSFTCAYRRFSYRFGHPGKIHIDSGSNLMSACAKMEISHEDLTKGINGRYGVPIEYHVCAVGSHEGQGQVERSIREIKKIFNAVFKPFSLTIMQYSTAFYFISNELNSIPICLGSKYTNCDNLDLISPSRLLLGRNNHRSPVGVVVADLPSKWMETMEGVAENWWKVWEQEWLLNLVPKSKKWATGEPDLEVGNVVVFLKEGKEADIGQTPWRIGFVHELHLSQDGVVREATLAYKVGDEKVYRYTKRSVRTLAVIHREHDVELFSQIGKAAQEAMVHIAMNMPPNSWELPGEPAGETGPTKLAVFCTCGLGLEPAPPVEVNFN